MSGNRVTFNNQQDRYCTESNLEVCQINGIKSDQCCEESHISFSKSWTSQVALFREDGLNSIQSIKHLPHCNVIGLLGFSKTSTIHSNVDRPKENIKGIGHIHNVQGLSIYSSLKLTGKSTHLGSQSLSSSFQDRGPELFVHQSHRTH